MNKEPVGKSERQLLVRVPVFPIDIAAIGVVSAGWDYYRRRQAVGFMRHVGKKDAEVFTTSLYEVDQINIIVGKKEQEVQDEPEMQALIDQILPE